MYHHIEGKLIEKTPTYAVIECGGVGYILQISLNTFSKINIGDKCKLYAEHMYIRDDMPRFFGFADLSERMLFRQLTSVSGVGGTSALLMLSSLSASEIQSAIVAGNVALLKSVKGIGEKTAQRIIVDLRDKLGKMEMGADFFVPSNNTLKDEALSALVMLGFAKNTAEKALEKVLKIEGDAASVEQVIKQALKNL